MTHGHEAPPSTATDSHEEPRGGVGGDAGYGRADAASSAGGHGHGGEALGPVDWTAWGAGAAGVLVGLLIALCFVLATGVPA